MEKKAKLPTINDLRIVMEGLEQRTQMLEAQMRKINENLQKLNQTIQFERF